jgi:hypothetical protein
MNIEHSRKIIFNEPTNRIKLILFSLLILLDTIIRIPSIPHEAGSDSFFIHTLANSLTGFGHANWWLHWLSVFGYYPYSYASSVPFSLSGISQLTGIEMEYTILIYCMILGVFSIFSAYLLAGLFFEDFLFKYLMAFTYSISPSIMFFTTWEISPRGPFNVFFPLILYLLLKPFTYSKKVPLFLLMLIYLFSVHHLAIIVVAFTFIYILLKFISENKDRLNISSNFKYKSPYLAYIYLFILIAAFMMPFFNPSAAGITGSKYGWISTSLTIIIRYIGPLSVFGLGGLTYLVFKTDKKINLWYILICFILIVPNLYDLTYGIHIGQLFLVILVTVGLWNLFKQKLVNSSKLFQMILILVCLSTVVFSSFYNHYRTGERQDYRYMDESTYRSGEWINHNIDKEKRVLFVTDGFRFVRSLALEENGSSIFTGGTEGLTYGFIDKNFSQYLEPVSYTSSYFYFEGAYILKERIDPYSSYDWLLATRQIGVIRDSYNLDYIAQATDVRRPIGFYETNKKEEIYSDGFLEIYDLRRMSSK